MGAKSVILLSFLVLCLAVKYATTQYALRTAAEPTPAGPREISGGFRTAGDLYTLLWTVTGDVINFRAKVKGTGFVGFGISETGGMTRADVFLAGIHSNGTSYAWDARENNGVAEIDPNQSYILTYAQDDGIFSEVHFYRYLDTGDLAGDLPIKNEPQYILWSIGPPPAPYGHDTFNYHGENMRGVVVVNLLNQANSGTYAMDPIVNRNRIPAK